MFWILRCYSVLDPFAQHDSHGHYFQNMMCLSFPQIFFKSEPFKLHGGGYKARIFMNIHAYIRIY